MKVTYIILDLEISTSRNISQENKFVKMYKGEGNGGGGTTTFNNSIKRKKKSRVTHFPYFPCIHEVYVNKLVY